MINYKPISDKILGDQSDYTKVPQITAVFWIIKILTAGMGKAASDFLTHEVF